MKTFAIDEGGYTGFDLLNPDQRIQGATAVAISDDDAARLICEHFPGLQATELKYSSVSRRGGCREPLLKLQRAVLTQYPCVTYICDKRFLLILFFLDYACEPYFYERGQDFYRDGRNYSLASLLYFTGPTLFGPSGFDALLKAFQQATKEKTPQALEALVTAAKSIDWRQLPEALGPIANSAPECTSAIMGPGVSTDAAFVVLQSLISRMEVMSNAAYRVEHDRSKNLVQYHDVLKRFIEHTEKVEFRQTEIAGLRFPLKLASVTQVDSKASPAIQIADVMVGSAIDAVTGLAGVRAARQDPKSVLSQYAEDQFIYLVPSLDFEEQKRFRRGIQASQMIDYFARNFGRRTGN